MSENIETLSFFDGSGCGGYGDGLIGSAVQEADGSCCESLMDLWCKIITPELFSE